MSADRPDDFDDVPPRLPHQPDDPDLRADYGEGPADRRPLPPPPADTGFGFWMAVVWCVLFFAATQIVIGLACGVPIILTAMVLEARDQPGPMDAEQMMKSDAMLVGSMLSVMCAHIGGLVFAWLVLRWQVGRQWKRKIALSRLPSVTHSILVLVGLVAMLAVGTWISVPIEKYVPSMEDILRWLGIHFPMKGAEMIVDMVRANPLALALFTVGMLPALDEEFWCRGFLANGLSRRYSTWVVVLIVSFLFGCLHVDPRQGLGAMFLGVVMHLAYIATRSLWAPMALHFFNNSLGVIHFYFQGRPLAVLQPFEDALTRSPALFVLGSLVLSAGVGYALWQTRCRLAAVDPDLPVWQPPGSGMDLPPAGSGTIVTHDRLSVVSVVLVLLGSVAFGLVLALA